MARTMRRTGTTRGRRVAAASSIAVALAGGAFCASAASAATAKATTVVKEVIRAPYGEILTNVKDHALYIDTTPPCTGGCLTVWPPLLMPKGKTVPAGATGLGTTPVGDGRLQVTYDSEPLYTFYTDTKKSVNGQGVGGFEVAQVGSSSTTSP